MAKQCIVLQQNLPEYGPLEVFDAVTQRNQFLARVESLYKEEGREIGIAEKRWMNDVIEGRFDDAFKIAMLRNDNMPYKGGGPVFSAYLADHGVDK